MPPTRSLGGAIVLLGDAPALAPYLANLVGRRALVEVAPAPTEKVLSIVRRHPRTLVIIGEAYAPSMNELITLRAVRNYGAILLSADHSPARFGDAVDDQLLPWMDVAWFVPETYRTFSETARGRTDFAHRTLTDVHESARSWFAEALMVCPWKRKEAAAALGISRAGLERRMLPYAVPWHALCDRMVLDVCAFHARRGDVKESVVAAELGCDTTTALSRRLHRLHTSWKALTRA